MAGGVTLRVAQYVVRIRFGGSGHVSAHLGNTLRGGFGRSLRSVSCVQPQANCRECLLGWRCAYGYLFDTPIPPQATIMRRYTHAPHPFVLRVWPDHPTVFSKGALLDLTLLLVGRAAEYFPYIVFALEQLGKGGLGADRVPFEVAEIRDCSEKLVYESGENRALVPATPILLTAKVNDHREGRFRLHFRTPTRLRVEGHVLRQPEFGPFMSAALRRLELLCKIHEGGQFEVNAAELADQAKAIRLVRDGTSWHDQHRHNRRQAQTMPLGGLVGWAEFEGDVGTFAALTKLAGAIHVGKNTAFGNGFCELEELDDAATS